MGLLRPRCQTQHFTLFSLMQLALAHQSRLFISLCRTFLPYSTSTFPLNSVSPVNQLRMYLIASGKFSVKMLNRSDPSTESWGTPFLTSHQLDVSPFTTVLWTQPSTHFFYPENCAPTQAISSRFLQENAMGNDVRGFTKVQVGSVHNLS